MDESGGNPEDTGSDGTTTLNPPEEPDSTSTGGNSSDPDTTTTTNPIIDEPCYTSTGTPAIRDADGNCVGEDVDNFINQEVWDTQDPYDDWNALTQCERDFFSSNPHHLYNARSNKIEAQNAALERFGDCNNPNSNPLHNTIGDAYRHAYFAALNTQNMGYNNAKALGDAHECDTDSDKLDEKDMDLNNNDWGYLYGDTMSYVDETHFYTSFMDAFQDGQIKILQECQ